MQFVHAEEGTLSLCLAVLKWYKLSMKSCWIWWEKFSKYLFFCPRKICIIRQAAMANYYFSLIQSTNYACWKQERPTHGAVCANTRLICTFTCTCTPQIALVGTCPFLLFCHRNSDLNLQHTNRSVDTCTKQEHLYLLVRSSSLSKWTFWRADCLWIQLFVFVKSQHFILTEIQILGNWPACCPLFWFLG